MSELIEKKESYIISIDAEDHSNNNNIITIYIAGNKKDYTTCYNVWNIDDKNIIAFDDKNECKKFINKLKARVDIDKQFRNIYMFDADPDSDRYSIIEYNIITKEISYIEEKYV